MKIQIVSRDYNGTSLIIQTVAETAAAIKKMKAEVSNANFENALTTTDKFRSIEAYLPVVVDESGAEDPDFIYAGNHIRNQQKVYDFSNGEPVLETEDGQRKFMFYIGHNEGKDYYLENDKGELVTSFDHELLEGKTFYFVKVVTG